MKYLVEQRIAILKENAEYWKMSAFLSFKKVEHYTSDVGYNNNRLPIFYHNNIVHVLQLME